MSTWIKWARDEVDWYDPMENEITEVTIIDLEKALKFYWRSIQIENGI